MIISTIAFGDGRPQRHVTARADDDAAQSEGIPYVLALGSLGGAVAAVLDLVEDVQRHERLMLGFERVEIIDLRADVPGIDGLCEDIRHALLRDLTFALVQQVRETLKKAFHLCLGFKAARRVSLKGLPDDPGSGLFEHKHFAATFDRLIPISDGRIVNPISVFHASPHSLCDLPTVLSTLKRTLCGEEGLEEFAFRAVFQSEVKTLDEDVSFTERIAQIQESTRIPARTLEIIEDVDELLTRLGIDKA